MDPCHLLGEGLGRGRRKNARRSGSENWALEALRACAREAKGADAPAQHLGHYKRLAKPSGRIAAQGGLSLQGAGG
jgi:hypothetical protein